MSELYSISLLTLAKYPKILAAILFGNYLPEFVLPKIIAFAESYSDTESQIPEIKKIVKHVLTEDNFEWIDENVKDIFYGIAHESMWANTNWYDSHNEYSKEAFFLTFSCLSSNIIIDTAFLNSSGYLLTSKCPKLSLLLLSASCDFILLFPWDTLPDALLLYFAACIACDITPFATHVVKMKLSYECNISEFIKYIDFYDFKIIRKDIKAKQKFLYGINNNDYSIIVKEFEELWEWMKVQRVAMANQQ